MNVCMNVMCVCHACLSCVFVMGVVTLILWPEVQVMCVISNGISMETANPAFTDFASIDWVVVCSDPSALALANGEIFPKTHSQMKQ